MYDFLNINGFFYRHQYGFRKGSGTVTATMELLDKIYKSIDKGEVVSALLIDLSKAFDCVDHLRLIYKLNRAGIRGPILSLLTSYLRNRKQFVSIDGKSSEMRSIQMGVPQGSILGPLLFLIYINDLPERGLIAFFNLFADDSCLLYFNKDVDNNLRDMEEDLLGLTDYFNLNLLTMNEKKTNIIHFHPRQKSVTATRQIVINNIKKTICRK